MSAIISYLASQIEDKVLVKDVFVRLGVIKEKRFYCIDCSSYVGKYEASMTSVNGRPNIHQEPRFSEGISPRHGMLIHNGFCQRRRCYFRQCDPYKGGEHKCSVCESEP